MVGMRSRFFLCFSIFKNHCQSGSFSQPFWNPIVCRFVFGKAASRLFSSRWKVLPGFMRFKKNRIQQSVENILCGSFKKWPSIQGMETVFGKIGTRVNGRFHSRPWWAQWFLTWLKHLAQLSNKKGWPSPKCCEMAFFSAVRRRFSYIFDNVPSVLTSRVIQAGGRTGEVYFDL